MLDNKTKVEFAINVLEEAIIDELKQCKDEIGSIPDVSKKLGINYSACLQSSATPNGAKGYFFVTIVRMLEDKGILSVQKIGSINYMTLAKNI